MKKNLLIMALGTGIMLLLAGCQGIQDEAQKLRQQTDKVILDASQQVETTKKQVTETKEQIDKKVKEAQDVADAVKKFTE